MAAPAPATQEPSSYREYFADDGKDPYDGSYTALLAEFRVSNSPPMGTSLCNLVGNGDDSYPAAFLGLVQSPSGDVEYQVVLGVKRYPATLGRRTPWDGKLYGFVGDTHEGLATSVEFPTDAFDYPRQHTNVPATLARAHELLEANPDAEYLDPLPDGDANIRQSRTRKFVPLPHRYVRLLLDRHVSPREGFIDMATVMAANGDDATCPELVDWLLLSIMRSSAGAPPAVVHPPFVAPVADRALLAHRRSLMVRHLGGLLTRTVGTPVEETQQQLVGVVRGMADEQRLARNEARDRAEEAKAPTTPSKAFGKARIDTLMALCGAVEEAHLPPVWTELAAAGKNDRITLEHKVLEKARELGMAEMAPIVTPELTKKVLGLQWAGINMDDLSEGIQPFAIIMADYAGREDGHEAQRLAETYDLMASASTTSTVQDAKALKTGKVVIVADYSEAKAHMVAMMILWTVLLGDLHPFVASYGTFVHGYLAREYWFVTRLRSVQAKHLGGPPVPALLLCYLQLRTINYWRKALSMRALPPRAPSFDEVLEHLEIQNDAWMPSLPQKYWRPFIQFTPGGSSVGSGLTEAPTVTDSSDEGNSRSSRSGRSSSGRSGDDTSRRQTTPVNHVVVPALAPFTDKAKNMKISDALSKHGEPPSVTRNGKTVPMCVSYHVRGKCWEGCARKDDHVPHTAAEDQAMVGWCQAAFS